MAQTYLGGLPIAFVRLLYIKYPERIAEREWLKASAATMVTFCVTVAIAYLKTVMHEISPVVYTLCLGQGRLCLFSRAQLLLLHFSGK